MSGTVDEMPSAEVQARQWVEMLETTDARKTGGSSGEARQRVARRLGVSPGTLENVKRGRLKGLRVWVVDRIREAVVREIEAEIARLVHELEIVRQAGCDPRDPDFLAAAAALETARALMERRK